MFGDHLGMGGEIGINYTSFDKAEGSNRSYSSFSTGTLFFLRWYF